MENNAVFPEQKILFFVSDILKLDLYDK